MPIGCPSRGLEFPEGQLETVMNDLDALIDLDSEISPNTSALHEELLHLEALEQKLSQRLRDISGRRCRVLFALTKKATLHSLPPELLVQVFTHATFADKSSYRWYLGGNVEWGPVEISHVCQRWRSLALGTSCLWTAIFARNAFAFATYIVRSGHQDIDLVWKDVDIECESESALARLSKLTCHGVRNRVRSIAWADDFLSVRTLFTHGSFPSLRRLILHRTTKPKQEATSNDIPVHELAALLGRLPLLEDLALNGYSSIADDAPTRVLVILPHLRAFAWNRASARKLWRLFTVIDFSGLQTLRLSTRTASKGLQSTLEMEHSTVIRLPKLRQFCLVCDTTEDFKLACRRLEFPSLESLVLARSLPGTFPILPNPAQIFREPRLAHVTQLSLHNLEFRLEDTVALLSYSPALKKLVLDSCKGAAPVLCALSRNKHGCASSKATSSRWLCPFLDEICLIGSSAVRFRCLASVIQERSVQPEDGQTAPPWDKSFTELIASPTDTTSSAAVRVPVTPRRLKRLLTAENAFSSPNVSLFCGWRAHEAVRPCRIGTVRVAGCARISRVELLSLEAGPYGVETVSWDPA